MRAAALYRGLTQSLARDWTRAARFCVALLACLAQFSQPAQSWHAADMASHAMVRAAGIDGSAGAASASLVSGPPGVPCALHGTRASPNDDGSGHAPRPSGDCPFCPCPCCAPLHAAIGILAQETARVAYAPPFSTIAPQPVRLSSATRFAVVAGQPRAPPILI